MIEVSANEYKRVFSSCYHVYNCVDDKSRREAYNIIKDHHNLKEFPLRMSYEQIFATSKSLKIEFFILEISGVKVAAAYTNETSNKVIQIIYWGDKLEYRHLLPMNLLSYKIFEYYKSNGYQLVDFGSSTDKGVYNNGLCAFKESIGCEISKI